MYMPRVERAHGLRLLPRSRGVDLVRRPGATAERAGEILAALASRVTRPALRNADLVVVGAGALGLTAALRVAKAGLAVQVIEAGTIGEGATALGSGQVVTGLKYDPSSLLDLFGPAMGKRLVSFSAAAADAPFTLIRHERLAVPHSRGGWVQLAHSPDAMRTLSARALEWRDLGALASVLGDLDARRATGAHGYLGGWVDRRGGVVEPQAYVQELAGAAERWGAEIAERCLAVSIEREARRWRVTAAGGHEVHARFVLIAGEAEGRALVPGLAGSLVDMTTLHMATEPLHPVLEGVVPPRGVAVSDSRRLLRSFRRTADGRLVISMRGGARSPRREESWDQVARALCETFPVLGRTRITRRWSSRAAATSDHLPHLHEPARGLLVAAGCEGRGLGLQTSLGQYLGDAVLGGDRGVVPLPFTPIRSARSLRTSGPGLALTLHWYRLLDRLEQVLGA